MTELNIGAHISIANGYEKAALNAISIGANTFQFFTRNPRGGAAKELVEPDIKRLAELLQEHDFAPLLAHSPYTINMASDREEIRTGARELIKYDMDMLDKLPCNLYNIHPGSRKKDSVDEGIQRIISAVNDSLKEDNTATFIFETMSGKGGEMGRNFNEIADMIDGITLKDKLGVCLDTCHVFCAGYDIVNDLDGVLTEFDKTIGLNRLKAIHLNDTMNDFNSNKDRHAKIGEGYIGFDAIVRIINHPALKSLPFYLETPNDLDGFKSEIRLLRGNYRG